MVEVFASGGIIVDNVVAADGTVHLETMGGNAVYAAAGAKLWLGNVGILSVVPANYPRGWLERLAATGLDTAGITVVDEMVEASEWFFYRPDGARADHLHAEPGALAAFGLSGPRLAPEDARRFEEHLRTRPPAGLGFAEFRRRHPVEPRHLPECFQAARGAHLAANMPAPQRELAETLKARGLLVTLDPGAYAPALAGKPLAGVLSTVDAILPSQKELAVLCPGLSPAAGLAALTEAGVAIAAVKLGPEGSLVRGRGLRGAISVPPLPVRAVDPTGAGDAYCGGFLAGLVRTGDPLVAACLGTVSASFAVEAFGPFHLLDAARAEAILRLECLLPPLGLDPAAVLSQFSIPQEASSR